MEINVSKLSKELISANISTHGNCNSDGVVWDDDNNEIQDRPDVQVVLEKHDPAIIPELTNEEKTDALWDSIANADNTKLDEVKAKEAAIAALKASKELLG